ncbi:armadillo-like helical domain-containing protein 4 isoform X3 [Crotalus tigris]|uniref:armadillo-like helical domain-containing protein 4 isoform X3 n=1 Tax=Crotalus tigris TaxID=88082 RepID=UPI00192F9575|nr:armadillo-like helical domain-containing protein 4 isoform X3 [Crotalus tigris]
MAEIICSAHFHANFSFNMSSMRGYHMFLAFCLILLNFGSLQCLVLRQVDERHVRQLHLASPAGNSLANTNASNPEGNLSSSMNIASTPASESLYGASAEPSGRSLNRTTTVKTTLPTILHVHNPLEHSNIDAFASTSLEIVAESKRQISLKGPDEKRDKYGTQEALIATVVTIPDLLVEDDTLSSSAKETVDGGGGEGNLDGDLFAPGTRVDPSDNPQVTIPKVINSFPATSSSNLLKNPFLPTSPPVDLTKGSDGSSFPTIWMGTDAIPESRLLPADASLNLEGEHSENQGHFKGILSTTMMAPAGLLLSDEWDDTKLEPSSQAKAMHLLKINQPQIVQPTGQEDDDVKKDLSPRLLETTAKGSKDNQNGSGQIPVQVEESTNTSLNLGYTIDPSEKVGAQSESPVENVDPTVIIRSRLFSETVTTTDATKSDVFQTLRHQLKGTATAFPDAATVPSPVISGGLPTQKIIESQNVMEKEIELATQISTVSSTSQLLRILETVAPTVSPPSTHLPAKMVEVEEPVTLLENKEIISVAYIPATLADLRVPTEMTVGTMETMTSLPSLASSTRQTTVLAAHRITTASTYGLERLESEEEEEEEEEDEEEEEEEEEEMDEDEEENDDDREPNLIDENLDDADLSSFTVPGETSQEPLEGLESPAGELSGIAYHVPNAIEWEQQNQGLVRSWMEKLKDKAGYMSGMLVPVGVGIAGALFILGALYSIKIMNRRRRNGFKRHKRKQREFNSMQDRVMLLADSSEDEF